MELLLLIPIGIIGFGVYKLIEFIATPERSLEEMTDQELVEWAVSLSEINNPIVTVELLKIKAELEKRRVS